MTYRSIRQLSHLTLTTFICGLFLGCEQDEYFLEAKNSTLVYCSEGSPDSFDPHTVTSGTSFDASARQLYNRLVEFKPGTVEIIPSLAERWKITKKGTEYTFYLRKGVSFHQTKDFTPTRHFNADDVIFSFKRQLDPSHPYHYVGKREFAYADFQGLKQLVADVRKIDEHTVVFELTEPSAPFLSTLAMEFTSILSAEYAFQLASNDQADRIVTHPVGTGPYRLKRYQADAFIRYNAHENYWKGAEAIKHLVFAITPDPSLRFARVTAGECDVMSNPLPVHLQVLEEQSDIEVVGQRGLNIAYWTFNTLKPPFDQKLVRQALNHAVNREAIMQAVYYGSAEVATNPIPPDMWSYNTSIKDYEYNPQLARNLLYRAGFPDGFETDIWAFTEQRSYNPNAVKMAELIQQDLRKIGVKANIITYEFGTFLQKVKSGEHQTALQGWIADNGDPDNFFSSLLSCEATLPGQNSAFWCHEEFDAIISDAKKIANKKERTKLYLKAQEIFKEEAPWLTVAHTRQFLIVNKRVDNLQLSPSGGIFFSGVKFAKPKENVEVSP